MVIYTNTVLGIIDGPVHLTVAGDPLGINDNTPLYISGSSALAVT